MSAPQFEEFVESVHDVESSGVSRPFDRMMFDVCGEASHIRAAVAAERDPASALAAFDRACERIYADPDVTSQRKVTLRTAEWILKAWCVWEVPGISRETALRWFDAWQRERNMAMLRL